MPEDRVSIRESIRANWKTYLWRALGGAIAIYAMQRLTVMGHFRLELVPFATSIVNVIGLPDAAPGQPRALIGGHIISALIGLVVLGLFGSSEIPAAFAVGLSIAAMHMTNTMHPPAGISPLIIVTQSLSWDFMLFPVLIGLVLLTAFAYVWHGIENRFIDHVGKWPARWF